MHDWIEQAIGVLLLLILLLDVFLTVLYARIGTGIISGRVAHLVWRLFLWGSRPFAHHRGRILSFCGPVILVVGVLVWAFGLTFGSALILHPLLGMSIRATAGPTPTDFVTALFVAGSSISVVGASDFTPHTGPTRMLFLFNSLIGMSVLSLILTYLMQVYTALRERNVLGFKVQLLSADTGDAAELVAGLGPEGQFSGGYTNLADMAVEMTSVKEAHHFYPVLFYFRFVYAHYSVSRVVLMGLDTVTLIKSALDDRQFAWLKESASVAHLARVCMVLATTLEDTFVPGGAPRRNRDIDVETRDRWRRRYFAALKRFRQVGIQTIEDEEAGAEAYVVLRAGWERHIATLAPCMAYAIEEIDPAGSNPERVEQRPPFKARLRSLE